MTTAKQLFQRKDPDGKQSLAQWWASVCHDDRFLTVLTYCRADFMEMTPTQGQIEGAAMLSEILQHLSDNEPAFEDYPTPGLQHTFTKPVPPTANEIINYGTSNT